MTVRFDDAGDALASHRQWIFNNEAYLEGPDGKPIAYDSFETTAQGKNEVGMAYLFQHRPAAGRIDLRLQDARHDHHQQLRVRIEGHQAAVAEMTND